jgi:hypothetical protein
MPIFFLENQYSPPFCTQRISSRYSSSGLMAMASGSVMVPLTTPFIQQSYCSSGVLSTSGIYIRYKRNMTCSKGKANRKTTCFPRIRTAEKYAIYFTCNCMPSGLNLYEHEHKQPGLKYDSLLPLVLLYIPTEFFSCKLIVLSDPIQDP